MRRLFQLALVALLVAVSACWWSLRSFRVFTRQELVAVVRIEPPPAGSPYRFTMEWKSAGAGAGTAALYPMHGEQWTVEGDILKWQPPLNLAGLRSLHKVTRLSSRYLKASDQTARPASAYELNGGTSPLWQWLYRSGPRLPGVEAVYGSAAYVPARQGGRWGVYVTLSGYMIKPLADADRS